MITLQNIGKRFPLVDASGADVGGITNDFFNDGGSYLWALKNISFSIGEGTILGIVGRNGAGKTTLLSVLAGLLEPTEGTLTVNGKVSCLFNLGTGFQDELSGEENIYLNGSLLGMKDSEIKEKFQSILEFSELNEFIHMPLGNYSQGMKLRLGFSVAMHRDLDVFIIDEVLMVGDGAFQQKCFEKLAELRRAGKTMVITSQNLDLIERLSDKVLLLERGEAVYYGAAREGIEHYKKILNEKRPLHVYSDKTVWRSTKWWAQIEEQWGVREGTREIEIEQITLRDRWGHTIDAVDPGESLSVEVRFRAHEVIAHPHFGIALFREDRVYCYGPNTEFDDLPLEKIFPGRGSFTLTYKRFDLMPGRYIFSIAVWDKKEAVAYDYLKGHVSVTVLGENPQGQLACLFSRFEGEIFGCYRDKRAAGIDHSAQQEDKNEDGMIGTVRSRDWLGRGKSEFFTGEKVRIEIDHDRTLASVKKPYLWVGIFRSDNIFCYARMRRLKRSGGTSVLLFAALPLLPGEYRVAVGIWDGERKTFVAFKAHGLCLAMCCRREDHGTIYLSHTWDVNINGQQYK